MPFWDLQFPQSKSLSLEQMEGGLASSQQSHGVNPSGIPTPPPELWLNPPALDPPLFPEPPRHGHGPWHAYCREQKLFDASFLISLVGIFLNLPICRYSWHCSRWSRSCRRCRKPDYTRRGRRSPAGAARCSCGPWPRRRGAQMPEGV